jgi:hypothetical protein
MRYSGIITLESGGTQQHEFDALREALVGAEAVDVHVRSNGKWHIFSAKWLTGLLKVRLTKLDD